MPPCTSSKLANDGNYPDFQPAAARANLSSTIDYHRSLLDQHRHQHESTQPSRIQTHPSPNHPRSSIRQWLPLSNARKTGPAWQNKETTRRCNKTKNEKDQNNLELTAPPYPQLTRKDLEEFEALPVAIRRKVSCNILILFSYFGSSLFTNHGTKQKKSRLFSNSHVPRHFDRGPDMLYFFLALACHWYLVGHRVSLRQLNLSSDWLVYVKRDAPLCAWLAFLPIGRFVETTWEKGRGEHQT